MSLILSELLCDKEPPSCIPKEVPVSIAEIDSSPPMDMDLPCKDPCPQCHNLGMKVGDYCCWGVCYACYKQALDEANQHEGEHP